MDIEIEKYINNFSEEFDSLKENLDVKAIEKAKELILKAEKNNGRVHLTGIGKPSYVAAYIASLFSSTGTPAYVLHGTEAVHGSSGQVYPQDIVIAISNSGETDELKATVQTVINNGATVIGVSGNDQSWIAKNSKVHLLAGVKDEGDSLNKPPRASILAEIFVLQVLSIVLQEEKNLSVQEYVKWHPGGSLGKGIRGNSDV